MTNPSILVATHTLRSKNPIALLLARDILTKALLAPHSLIISLGSLRSSPTYLHLHWLPLPKVF